MSSESAQGSPLRPPPSPVGLLIFLSLVALWDGFEGGALSQTLPNLRASFGMTIGQGGQAVALTNVGTIFGYFLLRQADSMGRRPVLLLSVCGYTLASIGTGAASGLWMFLAAQFLSRIFIVSALGVCMVYAVESFAAERHGRAVGTVVTSSIVGLILCALVTPRVVASAWGWRGVYYLVGPVLLLAVFGYFWLPETTRFQALRKRVVPSLFTIWRAGHGRRVVLCSLLWILSYATGQGAGTFWKEHAISDLGLSEQVVGRYFAVGSLGAIPLAGLVGQLLDRVGRRAGAIPVYLILAAGAVGAYRLGPGLWLQLAIVAALSGGTCGLIVAYTLTAESFPTAQRGDAMAWANSLLGRIGFVAAPLIIAGVAQDAGWGATVPWLAVCPLLVIGLLAFFPKKVLLEEEVAAPD